MAMITLSYLITKDNPLIPFFVCPIVRGMSALLSGTTSLLCT